jgi:hypothetical protein
LGDEFKEWVAGELRLGKVPDVAVEEERGEHYVVL